MRWDGRGLEVQATDASLRDILLQIASKTGASLQGPLPDQRIFGTYGPGAGCDVLSALLQGAGLDVVLVGRRGGDAPRVILLSVRAPAGSQGLAGNLHRDMAGNSVPPPAPAAVPPPAEQNPYANGEHPVNSVQFMQEILDRQGKIDAQAKPAAAQPLKF